MAFDPQSALRRGLQVLQLEADALSALQPRLENGLGPSFLQACELLLQCRGRAVVTGMGKAGLVGQKISATLASTGTPSLFLHPAEALHGDLGRLRPEDVVLALSKSGSTRELLSLLGPIKAIGAQTIAMCESAKSPLGQKADVVLELGEGPEACPLGLAPTVSTTVMLALGDALAMAVLEGREFTREEFARFHPAGSLGKQLMLVSEIMRNGAEVPLLADSADLKQALAVMSQTPGRPGAAIVIDANGLLKGIFTDGDLRRLAESGNFDLSSSICEHMAANPQRLRHDELVGEVLRRFKDTHVDQMPVVDGTDKVVGLVDVQDLLEVRL
ncbi:MAG: KpsF/GutQ family sugar-phosphate isomerase [Planctomycetes bacterium]|nr:KpsF/GutQ family sugar-phosphate isomerase [Planctomycetota bacterium]